MYCSCLSVPYTDSHGVCCLNVLYFVSCILIFQSCGLSSMSCTLDGLYCTLSPPVLYLDPAFPVPSLNIVAACPVYLILPVLVLDPPLFLDAVQPAALHPLPKPRNLSPGCLCPLAPPSLQLSLKKWFSTSHDYLGK
jgi:hypothetical protein